MSDSQNSLREFYKTDVILMFASLSMNLKELKEELIEELFNSIKSTRTQCQKELDELIEHVNQNTYAYADVRAQNQDLLITIFKLKNKLQIVNKGKTVNTKFDKFETSGTLIYVTSLPKNISVKVKKVSNTKVNTDRSKPVTSYLTPKNEQSVESFNSIRRPKSKDTKSKDIVLKNKNTKRPSAHVRKMSSSVSIDSIKHETMHSNVCQLNVSVLSTKTVNAVNDGSNIVYVSCGKDVFLLSHKKCVAHYASLSRNSSVKTALFTTHIAAKYKNLGATSVVAKSRLSVAKTTTATNKVSIVLPLSSDSSQSRKLSNYMKNKIATSRKWQKWFKTNNVLIGQPRAKLLNHSLMKQRVWMLEAYDWQYSIAKKFHLEIHGNSLGHNLFSVEQFCNEDLEVDFRSNTCCVWNLEGDDLLTGSRDLNLYTISIFEMAASSPVCLMSRATSTKSWLWHHRLSQLNFGTINQLMSKDLVDGLPKFKYNKDHLCSACEQGKSKKASFPPKLVPRTESKLKLLHMDLSGPMRVADEAQDMIIDFINQVQRNLKAQILMIQTDNGTKFKNEKLQAFYAKLGIVHKTSIAHTPQQNGVVQRRNQTPVEATRTMLIFSKTPEFLWAKAIATACFTQNHSIVHTQYNKTPYELIRGRKSNIQYLHVFGSLCYPTNDRDDLRKIKLKADIGIFIGYSETRNKLHEFSRFIRRLSVPSKTDLDNLFGPLYEEYYAISSPELSDNSAANTLDNDNTSSTSSINVEEDEAPQIVSSSAEQAANKPNSPVLKENADEFVQKDVVDFDGKVFLMHLQLLCSKKLSHLQHIKIYQICTSFIKNIAQVISRLRII
ncbi:retrovirus-related pol polyprotein from transposon TNT 1-94 [Tanacetum coccineum]